MKLDMKMYAIRAVSIFGIRSLLLFIVIKFQHLISVKQSLFTSLSQLEVLWQNDIDVVKIMETVLEENLPEYLPLKRYQ